MEDREMKKAEAALERMEREYRAQEVDPVRWVPPSQDGCRACGDIETGPWTVNIMSSKVPERGEAILFVAVLCVKCQGNEDRRDQAAENVLSAYLKSLEG